MRLYTVKWSDEDQEYVATCNAHPWLSWLEKTPVEALKGLWRLIEQVEAEEKKE